MPNTKAHVDWEEAQDAQHAAIIRNGKITYMLVVRPQYISPGHSLWFLQHFNGDGEWIKTDVNPAWDSEKKAIDAADKILEVEMARQNEE